jgi:hypothetical protein
MEKDSLLIPARDISAHSPAKSENRRRMRANLVALSIFILILALAVPQNSSFGVLANVDFDTEIAFEIDDNAEGGENPHSAVYLASFAPVSLETDIVRFADEGQSRLRSRHHYSPSDPRGPPIRA